MGKDCGRGNEQLDAKELAVNNVAEGEVGGPKQASNEQGYVIHARWNSAAYL